MLSLTLGLGVWQVQRLAWKRALLAEIERGESSPPVPLPAQPAPFMRVVVEGRFLPPVARYGAEVRTTRLGPVMGAHVISALVRPGSDPLIVDRGWAPTEFDPALPGGEVRIEGYVRPAEHPVWMGAKDDPAGRRFFALDPVAIGASLGLERVAPFTLVALGKPDRLPEPAGALPRPPNNHLSYALTWFGLSAALVAVFIVYARQALRPQGPAE